MYNIEKLKTLRKETGVSFSLCKKALEQSNNDLTQARKLLQKWGAEVLTQKKGPSPEGVIVSYIHHNKKIASLVEVNCQTDFVAANDEFQKLAEEIAMQITSMNPANLEELLNQEYIRDPSKKIADLVKEAALKFGESIKIRKFIRWRLGE